MRPRLLALAALALLAPAGCGGSDSSRPSATPPSAGGAGQAHGTLATSDRAAVESAARAIAGYCAKVAASNDPKRALPSGADAAVVPHAVDTLIAVARRAPDAGVAPGKTMRDALFTAQGALEGGCYPSQGLRIERELQGLR